MWPLVLRIISLPLSIALSLFALFTFFQRRYHFFQYLYFLRVPLLFALTILFAPLFTRHNFPEVAENLFTLDGSGLFLVTILSVFLAWVLMYTFWLLFLTTAQHNRLSYDKDAHRAHKRLGRFKNHLPKWTRKRLWLFPVRLILSGILLPSILLVYCYSYTYREDACTFFEEWPALVKSAILDFHACRATIIIIGILTAFSCWAVAIHGTRRIRRLWRRLWLRMIPGETRRWIRSRKRDGFQAGKNLLTRTFTTKKITSSPPRIQADSDTVFTKRGARLFALLTSLLYVLVGALSPEHIDTWNITIPPLAYVLILTLPLSWILPYLTSKLDPYRIPVLLVLLLTPVLGQQIVAGDYFYTLYDADCSQDHVVQERFGYKEAYSQWRTRHKGNEAPSVVVVAASGGGIAAARWTTVVLTQLQSLIGEQFSQSIVMISATSGGAVGTMYYIDGYDDDSPGVPASRLDKIVENSSTSSLGAIGWGLAYPDFWRALLGAPIWPFQNWDRAQAQEQLWANHLLHRPQTVQQWKVGIEKGHPIPVFNATISETGEPFLITPVDIRPHTTYEMALPPQYNSTLLGKPRGLRELYPHANMPVATAARLSAAFPYVTPMARPLLADGTTCKGYHVADGGYSDNFGVRTAIDFIRQLSSTLSPADVPNRIMLVEIRAMDSTTQADPRTTTTTLDKIVRPFDTILNANYSSQLARNNLEIQLLMHPLGRSEQKDDVHKPDVLVATFELGASSPLSWHLTEKQKHDISEYFPLSVFPHSPDGSPTRRKPKPSLSAHALANMMSLCRAELFFQTLNKAMPMENLEPDCERHVRSFLESNSISITNTK